MSSRRLFLRKKKTLDTSTRSVFQLFEGHVKMTREFLRANLQKKKRKKRK